MRALLGLLLAGLALSEGCGSGSPGDVTVSGKAAYRGMGIEEAAIEARRWDGAAWVAQAATRSGYHGTFRLRLPPGRYRLEGRAALPVRDGRARLHSGQLEGLVVGGGRQRVDRLVVELRPEGVARTR